MREGETFPPGKVPHPPAWGDDVAWRAWLDALPGRVRPPWWHPVRRWAWDHQMLAADGVTIFWERLPRSRESGGDA